MADNPPISQITIIGGGTAGWMTATLISRLFTRGYKIRLVESEEIGTIGVGEATIPAIKIYNQMAGIDELDLLRETQSTYKLGIEFVGWREPGHSYIHGFGNIGQDLLWLHTHQFWLRAKELGQAGNFDNYALNCAAARRNKMAAPDKRNPNSPLADFDYAYHFDASAYAKFLRRRSEAQVELEVAACDRGHRRLSAQPRIGQEVTEVTSRRRHRERLPVDREHAIAHTVAGTVTGVGEQA